LANAQVSNEENLVEYGPDSTAKTVAKGMEQIRHLQPGRPLS